MAVAAWAGEAVPCCKVRPLTTWTQKQPKQLCSVLRVWQVAVQVSICHRQLLLIVHINIGLINLKTQAKQGQGPGITRLWRQVQASRADSEGVMGAPCHTWYMVQVPCVPYTCVMGAMHHERDGQGMHGTAAGFGPGHAAVQHAEGRAFAQYGPAASAQYRGSVPQLFIATVMLM